MNHLKQKKLPYGYEFFGVGTHLELQRKMARMSSVVSRTPGLLNLWRGLGIEWGSEFSLDEVLETVTPIVGPAIDAKNLEFLFSLDAVPERLLGDSLRRRRPDVARADNGHLRHHHASWYSSIASVVKKLARGSQTRLGGHPRATSGGR